MHFYSNLKILKNQITNDIKIKHKGKEHLKLLEKM